MSLPLYKNKNGKMTLVHNEGKIKFYVGSFNDKDGCSHKLYNIIDETGYMYIPPPTTGYESKEYIELKTGFKFPERYDSGSPLFPYYTHKKEN